MSCTRRGRGFQRQASDSGQFHPAVHAPSQVQQGGEIRQSKRAFGETAPGAAGEKHLGEGTRLLRRGKTELRSLSIVFYGRGRRDFTGTLLKLPTDSREVRFVPKVAGLELKHSGGGKPGRPDLFQQCISPGLHRTFSNQEVALGELVKRQSQAGSCIVVKPGEELGRRAPTTEEIEHEECEWSSSDAAASEVVLENELVFLPVGYKGSGAPKTWSARGHFSYQKGLHGEQPASGDAKRSGVPDLLQVANLQFQLPGLFSQPLEDFAKFPFLLKGQRLFCSRFLPARGHDFLPAAVSLPELRIGENGVLPGDYWAEANSHFPRSQYKSYS